MRPAILHGSNDYLEWQAQFKMGAVKNLTKPVATLMFQMI